MARIDSVFDYYIMNYGQKEVTRYDSHKKSELRDIYNRIVKTNKDSPLYKLTNPYNAKRYAIDIKENAREIQKVVASLSDTSEGIASAFQKKVAVSSDEDVITAKYVGNDTGENPTENFTIEVERLASPQINLGNYIKSDSLSIVPGSYSFDLNTNSSSYEFQYSVNENETNRIIQNKLAKLVNNANLGIRADILEDGHGSSALQLTSQQTGLSDNESFLFQIISEADPASMRAMDILGIDTITSAAQNSAFRLNGADHTSYSNTFTINNMFELTLKDVSPAGEMSTIGFKANVDAVADNIQTMVDAYNGIIQTAERYSSEHSQSNLLLRDMSNVSRHHKSELESVGLMIADDGTISIDKGILADAITPERMSDTFDTLDNFKNVLGSKAEDAAINPMHYVNKVLIAYKNPGHNFATPYITSIYSGMLLDNYV